jgi:glutamate-1-semialdehyde 2,1-aminomutase
MNDYTCSNKLLDEALNVIPTGSQTFSKSHYSLPKGAAPLFLESGKGAVVKDVDGNEFIDLVNGLLCISLGYMDKDVNAAIVEQLNNGISFSLPHKLEMEVANLLVELIPCAEMVRFGKNGTDATSAAIRLARAYTGRNHIAICGYHGWQDWYIGSTTRDLGVPESTKKLSHTFEYNNLESLNKLLDEYPDTAAVIMEPMSAIFPNPGFLKGVRSLCDEKEVVLIFDEIITGFRLGLGGAQKEFGITPDLATFGKGMANGMPISAVVGKRDIMEKMEDIFFSGTFGGETLSLAASKSVITKMKKNDVTGHMKEIGAYLTNGVKTIIRELKIDWIDMVGHDTWKVISVDAGDKTLVYKTILLQELLQHGVLTIGTHNISYAFKKSHADKVILAYRLVLKRMNEFHSKNKIEDLLVGEVLTPVFKVR